MQGSCTESLWILVEPMNGSCAVSLRLPVELVHGPCVESLWLPVEPVPGPCYSEADSLGPHCLPIEVSYQFHVTKTSSFTIYILFETSVNKIAYSFRPSFFQALIQLRIMGCLGCQSIKR